MLGVSPREKTMGRGKRRRNRDWIRATWPREGIERARAESEDRRRPTRGVAGDDAGHGMGAYGSLESTVTGFNSFEMKLIKFDRPKLKFSH